jgi:hypothetical protein
MISTTGPTLKTEGLHRNLESFCRTFLPSVRFIPGERPEHVRCSDRSVFGEVRMNRYRREDNTGLTRLPLRFTDPREYGTSAVVEYSPLGI